MLNSKKYIIWGGILILSILVATVYFYNKLWQSNTNFTEKERIIYIPTNASYSQLKDTLKTYQIIKNWDSFEWVSTSKDYPSSIKSGAYKIDNGMSNSDIIDRLKKGLQIPIKVTFNTARTQKDLAQLFDKKLEFTQKAFIESLNNPQLLAPYQLTPQSAQLLFLPNTYEFYWNTTPEKVIEKMGKNYQKFWNEERQSKAQALHLSPKEVGILASIVQSESNKKDEQPIVAGVYLNRLKKNMKLQADPTVIFAIGDFSINRVLKSMLNYDSPYNTYKYEGLPPGPITTPNADAIDAVLNAQTHNYIFFCAKEDFSGYHTFASTLEEHDRNAKRYQEALTIYLKKKKEKQKAQEDSETN